MKLVLLSIIASDLLNLIHEDLVSFFKSLSVIIHPARSRGPVHHPCKCDFLGALEV